MRRLISAGGDWRLFFLALWLQAIGISAQEAPIDGVVQDFPLVTNLAQLHDALSGNIGALSTFTIEGTVLAVDPDSGIIFLRDDSGTEILQMDLAGQRLRPGQRVRLCGTNYLTSTEIGISLGKAPVVDDDGRHSNIERHTTVYLKAGWYPIEVLWFNYTGDYLLSPEYSGPDFGRRPIPSSALFRSEQAPDGKIHFVNGLDYRCFEGDWENLPHFQLLKPTKEGVATNFDVTVETRKEHVGLQFDGYIRINSDGFYTFHLTSDDGSQLFIHNTPVELTVTGEGTVPVPRHIAARQPLPGERGPIWAEAEGQVTFLGKQENGQAELELTSEDLRMRVVVGNTLEELPGYLLGSQVRVRGICPDTSNTAGYRQADTLVVPNWENIQVQEVKPAFWSAAKTVKVGDEQPPGGPETFDMVRIRGKLRAGLDGQLPELVDDTGSMPVELLNGFPTQSVDEAECLGIRSQSGPNGVLREAVWRELPKSAENQTGTNNLPLLTTAEQVLELSREEAQRGYRVKLNGVITWVANSQDWIVVADSARGVSVVGLNEQNWIGDAPKVGEKIEMEGTCIPAYFSPIVVLNKAKRLGMGPLPAPIHPTWEQLIGGSMDAQYVEISGLITASEDENHLTLLMPDGKMRIEFYPTPASPLASFVNSVVTIDGVVFANWNPITKLVTTELPLRFGSATICMDVPPPVNPFDAPAMQAKGLMQFDAERNTFQRVKVSGEFLYDQDGTCYMTDDGFGWRLEPVEGVHFKPGDTVDAVGLVQLGGASPVLREAIVRETGHLPLPEPQPLVFDQTNATYDSSRVWVEGLLLSAKANGPECVLEMQAGLRNFVARMPADDGAATTWPVGSRLKLTGVFSDLGGGSPERQGVKSFELLLNSPADVVLVARPPWWTLDRLLTVVALLTAGLALTFIWISLLRRQVERRTAQLKREISERQMAEQERAVEQERSRIARDLHDDLGSRVTAINMLAMSSPGTKSTAEASLERLRLIADKSRTMVTTLDGLVWAVDPKNDTLAALAEYLASFAEEFLARTGIACHVELPPEFPQQIIASETRHNALFAVSEALNNAVRHGHPSEVQLQLTISENEVTLCIRDNGCGFELKQTVPGNGLANLHERMRKVNGRCRIESVPGKGTSVYLTLPLDPSPVFHHHSQ
jgi:signal transduction histidine kinase